KNSVISEKWSSYKEDNVGKVDIDTDAPTLHLVHEMWDSIIKKVKSVIYIYMKERRNKSHHPSIITPLHRLAHSWNPRYYSHQWFRKDHTQISPHQDIKIINERVKYLKIGVFDDYDSLSDRGIVNPKFWWLIH
ncbi:hypothetical protein S83_042487, partial [Arachis hypogaea]